MIIGTSVGLLSFHFFFLQFVAISAGWAASRRMVGGSAFFARCGTTSSPFSNPLHQLPEIFAYPSQGVRVFGRGCLTTWSSWTSS